MATEADPEASTLAPDDAFAVLGNETRMGILQTLGESDDALSFSELRDRVGVRDSGQFNYHLDKLVGHFVEKTDEEYDLRKAGRRVIEAVLSGAITDDPVLEPTPTDEPCPYCETPILMAYQQERVQTFCPECAGHYGRIADGNDSVAPAEYGYLGSVPLPAAGLEGRTIPELRQAANTWGTLQLISVACRVCPRCSASLDKSIQLCESHDATAGLCETCKNRHAILVNFRCTNCRHEQGGSAVLALMANIDLLAFLSNHGINPVAPSEPAHDEALMGYEEEILSEKPLKARFTFRIDDDVLTLTVGDGLQIVDVIT